MQAPAIGLACSLLFSAGFAVAARHLSRDARRQIGHVEGLDPTCPAVAVDEPLPRRLDAASERRHHAESRDDVKNLFVPLPRKAGFLVQVVQLAVAPQRVVGGHAERGDINVEGDRVGGVRLEFDGVDAGPGHGSNDIKRALKGTVVISANLGNDEWFHKRQIYPLKACDRR